MKKKSISKMLYFQDDECKRYDQRNSIPKIKDISVEKNCKIYHYKLKRFQVQCTD